MNNEEAEKILEDAAAKLGEHFDSVVIMGSWMMGGKTHCSSRGTGNHYSRIGMALNYVNMDKAVFQAEQISQRINPPDESESWK